MASSQGPSHYPGQTIRYICKTVEPLFLKKFELIFEDHRRIMCEEIKGASGESLRKTYGIKIRNLRDREAKLEDLLNILVVRIDEIKEDFCSQFTEQIARTLYDIRRPPADSEEPYCTTRDHFEQRVFVTSVTG